MREESVQKQRDFFNGLAREWRKDADVPSEKMERLLEGIVFRPGERVLDLACGTGVLDAYLVEKGVRVDAMDVSEKMIERAKAEHADLPVTYFVADFYSYEAEEGYDKILVFDAYPHFTDRDAFVEKCAALTKKNGEVRIFFDEKKEKINGHHHGLHTDISKPLLPAKEEAERFAKYFDTITADESFTYVIALKKRG